MKRNKLKQLADGKVYTFVAKFSVYGKRKSYIKRITDYHNPDNLTMCIADVRLNNGKLVCSHAWLTDVRKFYGTSLKEGDEIKFKAKITPYTKSLVLVQTEDYTVTNLKGAVDYTFDVISMQKIRSKKSKNENRGNTHGEQCKTKNTSEETNQACI